MIPPVRIGIRGRLFWAFGVVAAATIAATVVAWVSFTRLGDTLEFVVGRNIPAVTFAAQLAERGGGVIGTAPALTAANTDTERERIWSKLFSGLKDLKIVLQAMAEGGEEAAVLVAFDEVVSGLSDNLEKLNTIVSERLDRAARKEELIERLRWASADFLDEVEPMIDDTRFNISLILSRGEREGRNLDILEREVARQRALFSINADGSLLAELIVRAANLPNADTLNGTEHYFHEIEDRIDRNLLAVARVPGVLSLRQSIRDIQAYANGEPGLFHLRAQELDYLKGEQELLAKNQALLDRLHVMITERVDMENLAVLQSVDLSQASIQQGRFWLIAAVIVSLLVAIPFIWLYVGRGLVGRITCLDKSMRAIAEGDLGADVPVRGDDEIGDMAKSLKTFRDTLSDTQAELVQAAKLAALGQLTAGISHEINQPLSAIRHFSRNTGLLIEKGRTDEAKANLSKIGDLVEKTNRIIGGLRALARKPKRDMRPTDIVSVFEDVLTLLENRLRNSGIDVDIQIDDSCRYVFAGQVRLEQVVLNLVNNAIDAMEEEPVRRLIISARSIDNWVDIRVKDTGGGMYKAQLEKIFDPFYTTKEVGEGLGLGLSVSYNIIKDFGGTLRAESQPDQGATFWIRLKAVTAGEPS